MIMYAKIRRMFYREYLSNNEIQRRTSLSRSTIKKWLRAPSDGAVKYQRAKKPVKLTPFESRLLLVLEADARRPRKDRRTAKMLFQEARKPGSQEARKDGYIGGIHRKVLAAHTKLCASRAFMLSGYPSQNHEMLFDAHTRASQLLAVCRNVAFTTI
ncbi:hypothetical protein [uncultured Nitrosomonas sp.]|uniref:hypothetical protein n=1 Tax=uncultured Nitrosomonas sp. TaxID=156424 RepID=UPI0025FCA2B7|nr:hypothetical protein [uncultured Nitrosomonas sp.]